MKLVKIITLLLLPLYGYSQTDPAYPPPPSAPTDIVAAEYFFDNDPGLGLGTSITITSDQNININNLGLDITGLANGVHFAFLRTKNANGEWSQTSSKEFEIVFDPIYPSTTPAPTNIVAAEYFFDVDPGFGLCTSISITPGQDININNLGLDITGLGQGVHFAFLRTQNANGEWSQTNSKEFEIVNDPVYPSTLPAPTNIVAAEYFFDVEPGFGLGTSISITSGQDININNLGLDITGLGQGVHFAFLRTQNANGKWSQTSSKEFEIINDPVYPSTPSAPTNIVAAEYFFDNDPGFGLGTNISITPGQNINISDLSLDVFGLGEGIHFIFLRTQNTDGVWSQTSSKEFEIVLDYAYPNPPTVPSDMIAVEYFIDTDPGFGNGTDVSPFTANLDVSLTNIPVDISGLNSGTHTLFLRTQNSDLEWSQTSNREFTKQDATDCTSTSTWDETSWSNGVPSLPTKAIVDGDFVLTTNSDWCGLEILSGSFTINQGVKLNLNDSYNSLAIQASGELEVEGILDVAGSILNNGDLVFMSNALTTGQLDDFSLGASITGKVEVQRFIPAGDNDLRAFRFLSTAVDSDGTIRANWQEGGLNPGDAGYEANFGTHITGSITGANGFDATGSANPSLLVFDNASQNWSFIANTDNTNLKAGNAYNIFVRGDRSVDLSLSSANQTPTNTTLRSTGTLATGILTTNGTDLPVLADQAEEWSFIGNPYQAIVDFSNLTFTGDIKNTILVRWNPNASTQGSYESIDNATPDDQMIQPGQSFFVQNSATVSTPPTIEFTETAKNTFGVVTTVFSNNQVAIANLELYDNDETKLDVMKFRFEADANNGIDDFDAGKLGNPTENLASVNGSTLLSIERRDIPTATDTIPLFINQYRFQNYEFQLNISNWDDSIEIYLKDDYSNQVNLLEADETISFTVDENIPGSIATDRFSLIFENTTLSFDNNKLANQINLYPNPTDGQFSIQTKSVNVDRVVKIYDMTSKQVFQKKYSETSNGELNVNAGNLAAGVYMVEMNANKSTHTAQLIIK